MIAPACAWLAFLRFELPGYLVLLGLLPLLMFMSLRSLSGLGGLRRGLAIAMRCAVVACVVLALAGAQRVRQTDELTVIFLIDRSASVPRELQQQAFDFVVQAREAMRPGRDRLGIVAFDGLPAVEQLPMGALGIERLSEADRPEETNIAAALRMAAALFTDQVRRRLVLLSDGNQNVGDALEEARQLAAAGIPVDVVTLDYRRDSEIVLERLAAPQFAGREETVNLQIGLRSQKPASGRILLYHNNELVDLDPQRPGAGLPITLPAGRERFQIPVPLRDPGVHRFRAVFEPDDPSADAIAGNNEGRAFTLVSGPAPVLILTTEADRASAELLRQALEREQIATRLEIAGETALDQVELLEHALVILSNVPASYLPPESRDVLASYVRDLGGGLIMIGGDQSFGAGGWLGSPVEEIMPVSFDVKARRQIPKGALVLVMHACEIPQGNYWGERVAIESVRALSTRDLLGVLAYRWHGADQGYWVIRLAEVGDKNERIRQIHQMDMGDLPDLDAVMRPGVEALAARPDAAVRHMIVISDFDPSPPRDDLIEMMKANRITCSTVAIGWGAHPIDVAKAQWMANRTGGKYYTTSDYSKLPQIFLKETQVVRRSLIHEVPFTPRVTDPLAPTIPGLAELPELEGYVLTTAKPLAQVPLVRKTQEGDDPILAHWQVGLGRTVAFTSGMWPRWGPRWVAWPAFSRFWAQIARWASRTAGSGQLSVTTHVEGGTGHIRVEALDKNASAVHFMSLEGTLVTPQPGAAPQPLTLTQTGPGTYEGQFDARQSGDYVFNLAYRIGRGPEAQTGRVLSGVSVAFSPEYRDLEPDRTLLEALRTRTGGRTLMLNQGPAAFDPAPLPPAERRTAIWETLLRLMLLLFLLDVAVRRIALSPLELARRLRRYLADLVGQRRPAEAAAAVVTTLKGARQRLREQEATTPSETGPAPSRPARYEPPASDARVAEELKRALSGATEQQEPVVAPPSPRPAPTSEGSYTARLLDAKRRARGRPPGGPIPPGASGSIESPTRDPGEQRKDEG